MNKDTQMPVGDVCEKVCYLLKILQTQDKLQKNL